MRMCLRMFACFVVVVVVVVVVVYFFKNEKKEINKNYEQYNAVITTVSELPYKYRFSC